MSLIKEIFNSIPGVKVVDEREEGVSIICEDGPVSTDKQTLVEHLEKNGVNTRVLDTVLFVGCSPIDHIKEVVESYKQTHLFHHPV
tara:strand:- start:36 stop:293 length:258 start_codon:yes stop_codon:yes gene_type:complete